MKSQTAQSSSPYHFAVTRIAVAQICRSIGFKSAQNSALSIITDIAGKYLEAVASGAVSAANAAGRTEANVVDIVAGLEYIHSVTGFAGGSNVNLGFSSCGVLVDVMKFVKYSDEIPFAKPLRRECLGERVGYSCVRNCENGRNYVPRWLPLMPEIRGVELRKRELWPCFDVKIGDVVEGESRGIGTRELLPVKRGKVKFKIEKGGAGFNEGLRKGKCGGAKRGLGGNWSGNQECSSNADDNKENVRRKKKVRKIRPPKKFLKP